MFELVGKPYPIKFADSGKIYKTVPILSSEMASNRAAFVIRISDIGAPIILSFAQSKEVSKGDFTNV